MQRVLKQLYNTEEFGRLSIYYQTPCDDSYLKIASKKHSRVPQRTVSEKHLLNFNNKGKEIAGQLQAWVI